MQLGGRPEYVLIYRVVMYLALGKSHPPSHPIQSRPPLPLSHTLSPLHLHLHLYNLSVNPKQDKHNHRIGSKYRNLNSRRRLFSSLSLYSLYSLYISKQATDCPIDRQPIPIPDSPNTPTHIQMTWHVRASEQKSIQPAGRI